MKRIGQTRRTATVLAIATALVAGVSGAATAMASEDHRRVAAGRRRGDKDEARRLLAAGAPVNARDNRRRTPLMIAVQQGDAAMARVLVEAGADINAQDNIKDSPFLLAGAWRRGDTENPDPVGGRIIQR
jgi:uncharacterized protein